MNDNAKIKGAQRSAAGDVGDDHLGDELGGDVMVAVEGVSKRFQRDQSVLADVDLTIERGELVTLVGPSGCGKSTLLRIIAGLEPADSGTVSIDGFSPIEARHRHLIAMAFQDAALLEWRDTAHNIDLPMRLAGWQRDRREQRVAELLDLVGLSGLGGRKVWELSGGMQQRVALARALALHPDVLLLDEPFGALDEITRERLQRELRTLIDSTATTALMVTHSVSEAVTLGDRTAVMAAHPGRIVACFDCRSDDRDARRDLEDRTRSALSGDV